MIGCNNFSLRGGMYCGNCGYHYDEHVEMPSKDPLASMIDNAISEVGGARPGESRGDAMWRLIRSREILRQGVRPLHGASLPPEMDPANLPDADRQLELNARANARSDEISRHPGPWGPFISRADAAPRTFQFSQVNDPTSWGKPLPWHRRLWSRVRKWWRWPSRLWLRR